MAEHKPTPLQKHQSTDPTNSTITPCAKRLALTELQKKCHKKRASANQLSKNVDATYDNINNNFSETPQGLLASSTSAQEKKENFCIAQAPKMAEIQKRFNRYKEALPFARAANELNALGDDKDSAAKQKKRQAGCLTLLPIDDIEQLNTELDRPPGTLEASDLRDDDTGYRAAIFRDESTGKLILVGRDTQPNILVDWQANTDSGQGLPNDQYKAMGKLSRTLVEKDVAFDVAGYSKGAGLGQLAGLENPNSKVMLFNGAGLHENALIGSGYKNFNKLAARTQSFSAKGEFLTYMNQTTDGQQQIDNARYLQGQLSGEGPKLFGMVSPMKIKYRNPAMKQATGWFKKNPDPNFKADLKDYLNTGENSVQSMIDQAELDLSQGKTIQLFPPVRAGTHETVVNSESTLSTLVSGSLEDDAGPNGARLVQHQMSAVLNPMEAAVQADAKTLQRFNKECGATP